MDFRLVLVVKSAVAKYHRAPKESPKSHRDESMSYRDRFVNHHKRSIKPSDDL